MPDVPNRDELEAELARKVSRLLTRHRRRLLRLMGDPPNLSNVPPSVWRELEEEYMGIFERFFESVYLDGAGRIVENAPVGVSWNQINEDAARWARGHAVQLSGEISTSTQTRLGEAVARFYEEAQTVDELTDTIQRQLMDEFGERTGWVSSTARAEGIAQTEVTRAAAQGELRVANELAAQGVQMDKMWFTNRDDIVCVICGPLHRQTEEVWRQVAPEGPPAHVRCRCWIALEYIGVDES